MEKFVIKGQKSDRNLCNPKDCKFKTIKDPNTGTKIEQCTRCGRTKDLEVRA